MASALLFVVLTGCAAGPRSVVRTPDAAAEPEKTIYVARRGWHVDVGFKSADLAAPLSAVREELPAARYVFFGFGDKRYLAAKNKHPTTLLAALWPGAGMFLVTGLESTPEEAFGETHVIRLQLSAAQMHSLQEFVWDALVSTNGSLRPYSEGPYPGSFYYDTIARYSGFHTCNTWVAEALHTAGLPIRSRGVVFAAQIWSEVERLAACAASRVSPQHNSLTDRVPRRLTAASRD